MHNIVAADRHYKAIQAEREQARVDRDAKLDEADRVLAAYHEAFQQAVAAGTAPPPSPSITTQHVQDAFTFRMGKAEQAEKEWMAANHDAIFEKAAAAEDKILARVAELVAELDEKAAEMGELAATLARVHQKAGFVGAVHIAGTDVDVLVAAARDGSKVLRDPLVAMPSSLARVSAW